MRKNEISELHFILMLATYYARTKNKEYDVAADLDFRYVYRKIK